MPPDLVAYQVFHRAMRVDSARLAAAIAEVEEPERQDRARQLHCWYDGFVLDLQAHHTVEDELFFPALLERVAVFEHQVGRIDTEHAHIDAALDRTRRAFDGLGDPAVPWCEASRRAVCYAKELHDLIERHLDFEDGFVLPMIVRHFGADEYEALQSRAATFVSVGQLPFMICWVMAHAEPSERKALLDVTPLAIKLIWLATRSRYRRITHEAFGTGRGGLGSTQPVNGTPAASKPVNGTAAASKPVNGTAAASKPVNGTLGQFITGPTPSRSSSMT